MAKLIDDIYLHWQNMCALIEPADENKNCGAIGHHSEMIANCMTAAPVALQHRFEEVFMKREQKLKKNFFSHRI